jgi:hypothetical protein
MRRKGHFLRHDDLIRKFWSLPSWIGGATAHNQSMQTFCESLRGENFIE